MTSSTDEYLPAKQREDDARKSSSMRSSEERLFEANVTTSSSDGASHSSQRRRSGSTTRGSGDRSRRVLSRRRASAHHADETFSSLNESHHKYKWQMFAPKGVRNFLYWLITGHSSSKTPPKQATKKKIQNLARTLTLLRMYQAKFGMPSSGSTKEQEYILEELCKQLYASGVPIWVLQPVMGIAATGLTGLQDFNFFLLPASGIIIPPPDSLGYHTHFFQTSGGFCLYRINLYEKVLARLASFSTNTRTINSVPDESLPRRLMQDVRQYPQKEEDTLHLDKEDVAKEILDLASSGYGLFFLEEKLTHQQEEMLASDDDESDGGDMRDGETSVLSYNSFWSVDESMHELFTRLATIEAAECLDAIKRSPGLDDVWPRRYVVLFRTLSSAGSSLLWFQGSWQDALLSGGIAFLVTLAFQTNTQLWKNQRVIFEVVVSFCVGLLAGLIAIRLPETTCFSGIAIASMIDYLRGFGIVFSVMQVMSKDKMSGSADLIEALVFSILIAISILFGLGTAEHIMQVEESDGLGYMDCGQPIPELWYILAIPLASVGWAAGFKPAYRDLPLMTLHGILAYIVSYAVEHAADNSFVGSFVAALTTSAVAGLVSRFTGRQALGDTFTGLFALVPGIYITEGVFAFAFGDGSNTGDILLTLILKAVVTGLGAWCGTLLCAPTNLGTNAGILSSDTKGGAGSGNLGAMLYI